MFFCSAKRTVQRFCLLLSLLALLFSSASMQRAFAMAKEQIKFRRLPQIQFIAALGDPASSSGTGAESWGIWRIDPGPRGVQLKDWQKLEASRGVAPRGWKFDQQDWWLEEYGRIMEKPDFPLPGGNYLVTGDREVTTVLTVHEPDASGSQKWELDEGTLYDVTHLPCRSARYTPESQDTVGTPGNARLSDFPVTPGAPMPAVPGCKKLDYAVLFVIGLEV